MRHAGIREARQNLTSLLEEVARGREVILTDRGRPVARLVPSPPELSRPFPGRASFRRELGKQTARLGEAILEARDDRFLRDADRTGASFLG